MDALLKAPVVHLELEEPVAEQEFLVVLVLAVLQVLRGL